MCSITQSLSIHCITLQKVMVTVYIAGYDYKIPFLAQSVTQMKDNEPFLYKNMFPPELKHPTLAVIGLVQAIGAIMPLSEIQCRWYASIMTGTTPGGHFLKKNWGMGDYNFLKYNEDYIFHLERLCFVSTVFESIQNHY